MSQLSDLSFSQDWETIREIVQKGRRFLITTHVNADPDGLGSELALAEALRAINKEPHIVNPTQISKNFSFLDPKREIQEYTKEIGDLAVGFDAVFILDISRWERLALLRTRSAIAANPKSALITILIQEDFPTIISSM